MNLLIVDDHPTNRKLLRAQLEAEGHGVLDAANGIEALEVLDRENVDGVISDILMPGMDGFRLCLEIRKRKNLSRLPFVFYTSTYTSPQDRELARSVGSDQYLTKPSATRAIISAVEEATQKTRDRIAVSAARHSETEVLKQYNEALVRKLEERNTELEGALKEQEATHHKMRENEARFRQLAESINEVFFLINANGTQVLYISPAYERVWERTCESLYARAESWVEAIHPDDQPIALQEFEKTLKIGRGAFEYRIVRPNGSVRWIRDRSFPVRDESGNVQRIAGIAEDITERKLQERRIEKLSRVSAVSGAINAAIVRTRGKQELFEETCKIAVEQARLGSAWIGALDAATLDITPVAWAGEGSEEMYRAKSTARDEPPRGQGAVSRAVRERRVVFNNDLSRESFGGPRLQAVLELGFHSLIALPLFEGDTVAGTLALYAKEPGYFDDEEVKLLTEVAGNLSLALDHLARQQKLAKLSRIRAVMSEVNAAIVRIRDRQALFDEACRIAVEHGKFAVAWIGTRDRASDQLRPAAWVGLEADLVRSLHVSLRADGPEARGTIARAVGGKRPVWENDFDSDPGGGYTRRQMLEQGFHSAISLPLLVDGEVDGVFVLYAKERGFFTDDEVGMLAELAADVSFALQGIAKQERLDYLSYYDALTGLPNRVLFVDRASQQIRTRGNEPLLVAMILLNLERFRNINETFGRNGGDALLNQITGRLESAFHGKDYIARIAADTFGVLIRGVRDATAVAHVVEGQVLGCFREPYHLKDNEVRVAARAGIAVFPADGGDPDSLFRNAEAALKKVRESGDRYLFYAADMNAHAAHALSLETRLRKAVEAREFVLHYQPKFDLAHGRICGLEALIRWQEPGAGLVAPGAFIPMLEETGMIVEVGQWAIGEALRQYREWTARGCTAPRVAVNVSATQLQQKDFVDRVIGVVQAEGDNPDALELEVTESLLMKDVQASIRKLSILRGLGIQVAIDDFGTGYSSLSYIARLPINSLKIDRSFINGMAGNPQDMSIVSTIIALAHSLNLQVVAEGVETEDQAKLLRLLKCDEAQGFLFSKPLPATEIEHLLRVA